VWDIYSIYIYIQCVYIYNIYINSTNKNKLNGNTSTYICAYVYIHKQKAPTHTHTHTHIVSYIRIRYIITACPVLYLRFSSLLYPNFYRIHLLQSLWNFLLYVMRLDLFPYSSTFLCFSLPFT